MGRVSIYILVSALKKIKFQNRLNYNILRQRLIFHIVTHTICPAICKLLNHIEIPGPKNSVGNSWSFWVIAQRRVFFFVDAMANRSPCR